LQFRASRRERHVEVVNRTAPGSVRRIVERREVRGVNCNCGYGGERGYRSYRGDVVSYRD